MGNSRRGLGHNDDVVNIDGYDLQVAFDSSGVNARVRCQLLEAYLQQAFM